MEIGIHAGPDFDLYELFLGNEGLVTLDPAKVPGSRSRIDPDTHGFYGFSGPTVLNGPPNQIVSAWWFTLAVADFLGIMEDVPLVFERPLLFAGPQM